jgi:hypothetical protein
MRYRKTIELGSILVPCEIKISNTAKNKKLYCKISDTVSNPLTSFTVNSLYFSTREHGYCDNHATGYPAIPVERVSSNSTRVFENLIDAIAAPGVRTEFFKKSGYHGNY